MKSVQMVTYMSELRKLINLGVRCFTLWYEFRIPSSLLSPHVLIRAAPLDLPEASVEENLLEEDVFHH